jgi:hypothetical protein
MWSSIDGLSTEEAAEVRVCRLCCDLQLVLQARDPALHEMHVIQKHPATLADVPASRIDSTRQHSNAIQAGCSPAIHMQSLPHQLRW